MAGSSQKEVWGRIRSMTATRQLTRAMEMVAASKLSRAQTLLSPSRDYAEALSGAVEALLSGSGMRACPYLKSSPGGKALFIVIAGDRGLAGGYNSRVLKLAEEAMAGREALVLPLGKKALEYFRSRAFPLFSEAYPLASAVEAQDCVSIGKAVCTGFLAGDFREVYLAGTHFDSILTQTPQIRRLLPPELPERPSGSAGDILWEPDPETVLEALIPAWLGGTLYHDLCQSRAAEQAARRSAMHSATQNADELIAQLRIRFNRSRQAAITREITEIAAGS